MSKEKRIDATAKAMCEASIEAALVVEGCENKHHLKKAEALDVLSGCVVHYLIGDGATDKDDQAKVLMGFVDHLCDYAENVLGIKLFDDDGIYDA